ncbi:membrane protein, putative [Babesia bigemina]|uniref:Membrane protein, putative n=1 Tax=Babesia bigemina TaxID=5866 RepID=A0A061DAC2_BABBI|nr:membrane protein, putative [Babesia bigemina]CDR95824.1 membrane protein, putative [Babesia bigemina]|eukprot:XP_012768010.1 membrane protein, putative [Babesia bigemina]
MKFLVLLSIVVLKSALALNTNFRNRKRDLPSRSISVNDTDVETYLQHDISTEFRDIVRRDIADKTDELISLIVKDVEKLIEQNDMVRPVFLENALKENAKRMIKSGVISIVKHMVPVFERWIVEAIKPPVTSGMVYTALVKPIGKSIFDQLYHKFNLPTSKIWDKYDDNIDMSFDEAEEDAEGETDVI